MAPRAAAGAAETGESGDSVTLRYTGLHQVTLAEGEFCTGFHRWCGAELGVRGGESGVFHGNWRGFGGCCTWLYFFTPFWAEVLLATYVVAALGHSPTRG